LGHLAVAAVTTALTAAGLMSVGGTASAAGPQGQVRTFESDPVGAVPAGCETPAGAAAALVSDIRGQHSRKALRVDDESSTTATQIACPTATRVGATLRLAVYPATLPHGFSVSLLGQLSGIDGPPAAVFSVGVTNTGAVRWFDAGGWTQIAPPGTVPVGRWSTLALQVPRDQEVAHVAVNGHGAGNAGPVGVRAVANINGFQVSSDSAASTGDDVFLDNVSLRGPGQEHGSNGPFRLGPQVTIDQSDTPLQMPNTAVTVPDPAGHRILVSYPAHSDASDTAGNTMASSIDGGKHWSPAQERNPMPDAPSYGLTRLRNGDLLAVDYHTYMTPDSGNLSAEVPTALSRDDGRTWEQRSGVLTTPQAMRPISTVTDRPGSPLGGFVLVHGVVEDPDGTLYQSGYGYYDGDRKYRQIVLTSTDEGANWKLASTIAYNPDLSSNPAYEGFCEGAIARTADGSLLVVMRTGSYQQMYTARSVDNGANWSAPQPLVAGQPAQPVVGIYPSLIPMADGTLVLWIGRPGQAMLASPDGNGRHWTAPQEIDYRNSGNGVAIPVDVDRLLVFGDRGANWSHPTPAPYQVWSRLISVTRR
jgi:hypothetical protein